MVEVINDVELENNEENEIIWQLRDPRVLIISDDDDDDLILESNDENSSSNIKEKKKRGRKKDTFTCQYNRWKITMFDKTTNKIITGKYRCLAEINAGLNLKLNSDYVRRIMTHYRVSEKAQDKEKSFTSKWGHIQIEKIHEIIVN